MHEGDGDPVAFYLPVGLAGLSSPAFFSGSGHALRR